MDAPSSGTNNNMRKRTQTSPPPDGHNSAADAAVIPSMTTASQPPTAAAQTVTSAPRRPRRVVHPSLASITSTSGFVGFNPYTSPSKASPAGRATRPRVRQGSSAPLLQDSLPSTVQEAAAATERETGGKARNTVMEAPSRPLALLKGPTEIWLLCAFTMEVETTHNCLGDTVNSCLKCMSARYSHVELVFGFDDGTWQALKTNMARGTVLMDAETAHYRNQKVWKAFRFHMTPDERTEFYSRAVAYQGSPFNSAALTLYTPGCYSLMRYCFCCFNCCLGISYDTVSGRYYCTQIVLLVMQAMFPAQYYEVDATSIVPDALVPLLLRNGHAVSDFFQRGAPQLPV